MIAEERPLNHAQIFTVILHEMGDLSLVAKVLISGAAGVSC